jgi:uncharacterized membrane protein
VNRYIVLYLATLVIFVALDALFLGVIAKNFFYSRIGEMLGELKPVPAVIFYLLYVTGVLIFVSSAPGTTSSSTLLFGALFGLFCYATFELTALTLLKHWSWEVAILDIVWGAVATALSSTAGLAIANWITPAT